ncbi:MAG: hypothetical protein DRN66_00040 [Candidatus Nanohalarchaeota archaeon]|nr:MAG: hypothetical protein DRN66_00040 [Candidatus Nanohaloarchaeota archaeon]
MKLLIIGREKPTSTMVSFLDAFKSYFEKVYYTSWSNINIDLLNGQSNVFSKSKELLGFDALFALPRKKAIDFTTSLTSVFEMNKKYVCFPSDAITLCNDLFLLFFTLNTSEVPILKTYYATNGQVLKARLNAEEMKLPVVIRPKIGQEIIINNRESINTIIDALETLDQPLIVQELKNKEKVTILSIGTSFFAEQNGEKYDLLNEQKNIVYKIRRLLNIELIEINAYIDGNSLIIYDVLQVPHFRNFFSCYGEETIMRTLCKHIRDSADIFYEKNPLMKMLNIIKKNKNDT